MWLGLPLTQDAIIQDAKGHYTRLLEEKSEYHWIEAEPINDLFEDGFLDFIWDELGGILDYGDVEFFSPAQCSKWAIWLERQSKLSSKAELRSIYKEVLEVVKKAIELDTGIALTII